MGENVSLIDGHIDTDIENQSICHSCFHSYVCEQFNENRHITDNKKCHFHNDHFVASADLVEVVRCKDCIYRDDCPQQITHTTRDYALEQNVSTYNKVDFCSYGERRGKE